MASRKEAWPLFAKDTTTAKLLDMDKGMFRRLVADGVLPGPVLVGGLERWDVEALQKALRGESPYEPEPNWDP